MAKMVKQSILYIQESTYDTFLNENFLLASLSS